MVKFKGNFVKLKEQFEQEYDFKSLIQISVEIHQIISDEEVYPTFELYFNKCFLSLNLPLNAVFNQNLQKVNQSKK